MTAARIIEAVGSLLWPLLAAVLVVRMAPHVPGLVADLRRGLRSRAATVRVGGADLTVEEATEQLRRQLADLQERVAAELARRGDLGQAPTAPPAADQGRRTLLWVDDQPLARALELAKLRDDGLEVLEARSTAEAIDVLSLRRGVHAVVTGIGRAEDGEFRSHAGLALLRRLREAEHDQPVIVYAAAHEVERAGRDALEAGATLVTISPTELFAAVRRVLAPAAGEPQPPAPAPASPSPEPGLAGHPPRRPSRPA